MGKVSRSESEPTTEVVQQLKSGTTKLGLISSVSHWYSCEFKFDCRWRTYSLLLSK
jgi:hypothetical protein